MKNIMIQLFCLLLFSSLYSMETVPLLEKDYLEKNKQNVAYEAKIPLMHYVVTSLLKDMKDKPNAQIRIFQCINALYKPNKEIKIIKIGVPTIKRDQNLLAKEELRRQIMERAKRPSTITRGAAWGGFFGGILGGNGAGAYYFGDGCVRCCCIKGFTFMSTSLMNKIMCYAVCGCTCAGCVIGATCVATGCSKDIDHYFA